MPPLPSDAEPRPPEDFAPLLATKEPVLLVGGQAVNLWAMYYETRTTALAPFVSRDVDVLGDRETLEALGKLAGTKPQFFPVKPPTNEIGVVIAKDHNGLPLLIEVLRYVHGVSNTELREPVYTLAVGETHVQVPSPIALLQAKIANVADCRTRTRYVVGNLAKGAATLWAGPRRAFATAQRQGGDFRIRGQISGSRAHASETFMEGLPTGGV